MPVGRIGRATEADGLGARVAGRRVAVVVDRGHGHVERRAGGLRARVGHGEGLGTGRVDGEAGRDTAGRALGGGQRGALGVEEGDRGRADATGEGDRGRVGRRGAVGRVRRATEDDGLGARVARRRVAVGVDRGHRHVERRAGGLGARVGHGEGAGPGRVDGEAAGGAGDRALARRQGRGLDVVERHRGRTHAAGEGHRGRVGRGVAVGRVGRAAEGEGLGSGVGGRRVAVGVERRDRHAERRAGRLRARGRDRELRGGARSDRERRGGAADRALRRRQRRALDVEEGDRWPCPRRW